MVDRKEGSCQRWNVGVSVLEQFDPGIVVRDEFEKFWIVLANEVFFMVARNVVPNDTVVVKVVENSQAGLVIFVLEKICRA